MTGETDRVNVCVRLHYVRSRRARCWVDGEDIAAARCSLGSLMPATETHRTQL